VTPVEEQRNSNATTHDDREQLKPTCRVHQGSMRHHQSVLVQSRRADDHQFTPHRRVLPEGRVDAHAAVIVIKHDLH